MEFPEARCKQHERVVIRTAHPVPDFCKHLNSIDAIERYHDTRKCYSSTYTALMRGSACWCLHEPSGFCSTFARKMLHSSVYSCAPAHTGAQERAAAGRARLSVPPAPMRRRWPRVQLARMTRLPLHQPAAAEPALACAGVSGAVHAC